VTARVARRVGPLVVVALLVAGCYPASPSSTGREIKSIYDIFFVGGAIVTVFVWLLFAWVVIRYRKRDATLPRQIGGHLPLEVVWTVVPAAIVISLFLLTWQRMEVIVADSTGPGGVDVHVWAFRWQWRFDYPDEGVSVIGTTQQDPVLVVPVGTPIHVTLDSRDVDHSFYVPQFLFKKDAIPGITNHFDFTVHDPGEYYGQCAEYCGTYHYSMRFSVRAVSAADYQAWLAAQPKTVLPTPPPQVGAPAPAPQGSGP
jgi:cytochrome c oxidase subunit 2